MPLLGLPGCRGLAARLICLLGGAMFLPLHPDEIIVSQQAGALAGGQQAVLQVEAQRSPPLGVEPLPDQAGQVGDGTALLGTQQQPQLAALRNGGRRIIKLQLHPHLPCRHLLVTSHAWGSHVLSSPDQQSRDMPDWSHESRKMEKLVLVSAIVIFAAFLPAGWGDWTGKEDWGYVEVRGDAHLFWWLYYAQHPSYNYTQVPLVMWLQGGPGASGCGFGNFDEIGPLDTKLKSRNSSWVQVASLLFVDSPVGTGYSYTTNSAAFTRDAAAVSNDMLILLRGFFSSKPEFQETPFFIFSESYGGKMAAVISLALHKAIQAGDLKCNFGGVALGDSWISPIDSVVTWGPYLYSMSLLDDNGLKAVQKAADAVQNALDKERYKEATELWSMAENVIEENTDGVNFYNILTKDSLMSRKILQRNVKLGNPALESLYQRHMQPLQEDELSELMNGPIRAKLKIIPDSVTWGGQAADVFTNMAEDFMKPVVSIVDELLCAGINVTVYNGQLDLIVDTVGQERWVSELKWASMKQFKSLRWTPLHLQSRETSAFYKSWENFSFYWILRAGHMVPSDQPEMSLKMLRMITNQKE